MSMQKSTKSAGRLGGLSAVRLERRRGHIVQSTAFPAAKFHRIAYHIDTTES
jgi:hypothetical protein